jgi:release factor glutamine methyltransferase
MRAYYAMTAILTTEALLEQAVRRLTSLEAPALDAELLLAHVLGVARARLKSHPEEVRAVPERDRYLALIERRARGEPLAYLTGRREFWSLPIAVDSAVLVPRPETELLVERALALGDPLRCAVADLGTGSGAIALALAHERPAWRVLATDVSEDALRVARHNAQALHLQVELVSGSWFAPLAGRRFDLLLSNPPYVAGDDPLLRAPPLLFEPRVALSPGADAMLCLRELIAGAGAHLQRGGWLLLEHGATQADDVARALVARGFGHVRSHRDLAGQERVTEGRWDLKGRESVTTPTAGGGKAGVMVRFHTSQGDFTIELFEKEAPLSVENFLRYVDDEFFDGTVFHRVVPGFVIQGGGLTPDLRSKRTREPIKNEAHNGLKNQRGTLSMARTNDINSATSQFFVNLKDNDFLDHKSGNYGYAVFGRVTEGMDVIDRIAAARTARRQGHDDVPVEDVLIVSARRTDPA